MDSAINQLKAIINHSQSIAVIGHKNPDGDTVGSVLGMYQILKKMNKTVRAIFPDDAPDFLKWLPFYNEALIFSKNKEEIKDFLTSCDFIFCLDFNEKARMGQLAKVVEKTNATKAIIDHHPYPDPFFDIIISEQEVSSTAELCYYLLQKAELTNYMDTNSATCIFTGILTDTLSFTVNAHRPQTFEIAARLLSFNINREVIQQKVFYSFSEQRMRLLGYALHKKMKILHEWSTGYIYLTKDELNQFCFHKGDSEGIVNYPLSIKGIRFAALFLERDNYIKISFRSVGNIPVNEIMSKHFVGGGHKNAAGGEEYELSLDDTLKKFEQLLPLYKELLQS